MTKGIIPSVLRVLVALPITCFLMFHGSTKVDAECGWTCNTSCTGEGEGEVCNASCVDGGGAEQCWTDQQGTPAAHCEFSLPMCGS
jgi:hypothetical protein